MVAESRFHGILFLCLYRNAGGAPNKKYRPRFNPSECKQFRYFPVICSMRFDHSQIHSPCQGNLQLFFIGNDPVINNTVDPSCIAPVY
jgi:hypothetical protein